MPRRTGALWRAFPAWRDSSTSTFHNIPLLINPHPSVHLPHMSCSLSPLSMKSSNVRPVLNILPPPRPRHSSITSRKLIQLAPPLPPPGLPLPCPVRWCAVALAAGLAEHHLYLLPL